MMARFRPLHVWLGGILVCVLTFAATWKLTIANRIIARGDLLLYFYPLRDYASAAVRAARLPLWNPYSFMGAPFLANSQVGFFYPLNLLLAWVPVAHAVAWSITAHLMLAGLGMYICARRGLRLGILASLAAAITFGLGGYLGAQVEHLNQLQVLAWLPWQVMLVIPPQTSRIHLLPRAVLLALTVSLQIFAGHTQSLYICLVILGIVVLVFILISLLRLWETRYNNMAGQRDTGLHGVIRSSAASVGLLAGAIALGILMSSIQLVPTLELATQSTRAGGLPYNEVGSFSWRPWVVARALMPTYGDPLFPEYVTYLGASGLALALLGALGAVKPATGTASDTNAFTRSNYAIVAIVLMGTGTLLALGIATPLFSVLYRIMPGFDLFRAQARWLIMLSLGAAWATGLGVHMLWEGPSSWHRHFWLIGWTVLIVAFVGALLLGARFSPEAEYRNVPATSVVAGWVAAFAVVTAGMLLVFFRRPPTQLAAAGACALLCIELLAASQFQPYARASDDAALTSLQPSTAHLLAGQALRAAGKAPPGSGRILSISGLLFDPGDLPEQTLIYGPQLSKDELYDRIVATKQKEVLSPNLSVYYRLPDVDGYDGGLLPLRNYTDFVKQFVPAPAGQSVNPTEYDGRLREMLTRVPANDWLQRMAVKYLITDKTHDIFIDNVYYDMQFSQSLSDVTHIPLNPFPATSLGVVLSAPGSHAGDLLFQATLTDTAGVVGTYPVRATRDVTGSYIGVRLNWAGRRSPGELIITPTVSGVSLLAMTSIDQPGNAFQTQPVRGQYDMRLVYSGDVKIYANQRPAPRAFFTPQDGLKVVDDQLHVVAPDAMGTSSGQVTIGTDEPERLVLTVVAPVAGWLVVRDAYYPGWVARIDGRVTSIDLVDTMFRAVPVPAGNHTITFTYQPVSVQIGEALSALGMAVWLSALVLAIVQRAHSAASKTPHE